jgi:hypothetical protein
VCFATNHIGASWLDMLATALLSEEPHERWSSGRLELRGEPGAHTFEDANVMLAEARARWADLLVLQLSRYGESQNIFVTVEPKLDRVRFEVRAEGESAAKQALVRLDGALGLEEYPDRPYETPRSRRAWRFRSFDRKTYAETVRDLICDYLMNSDPVVWQKDTYVSEMDPAGNLNDERFSQLEPFVARLLDKRPFTECQIVAVGPHDRVLGFFLNSDHSLLEVKSSFEGSQFEDVARALENRLPLKRDLKVEKSQEGAVGEPPKGWAGRVIVGIGMLFSAAFGVAATFLADRIVTRDALAIITPPAGKAGDAIVGSDCITFEWGVSGRTLFSEGRTLIRETGRVEVYAANGRRIARFESFRSGDELFLPVGKWSIYVYDPMRQLRSETLSVKVEEGQHTPGPISPVLCRDDRPVLFRSR